MSGHHRVELSWCHRLLPLRQERSDTLAGVLWPAGCADDPAALWDSVPPAVPEAATTYRWFKDKTQFEDMGKAGAGTCWPREVVLGVGWRMVGALGSIGGLGPTSWRWDGEGVLGGPRGDPRGADSGAQHGQTAVRATPTCPAAPSAATGRARPCPCWGTAVAGRHRGRSVGRAGMGLCGLCWGHGEGEDEGPCVGMG